jgi:predicted nucleotidyltransferase
MTDYLSALDRQALTLFQERLRHAYPKQVVSIQLFGSKARGTATEESDVDLLVVMTEANWRTSRRVINLAARVWTETGVNISPKVYSQGQLADMRRRRNVFLQSVEQDALPV